MHPLFAQLIIAPLPATFCGCAGEQERTRAEFMPRDI